MLATIFIMINLTWERQVLPNDLRVLLFPRPAGVTTQLSLAIAYGSNSEPENASGIAHFLEHMIAGGSKQRIELSQSIEKIGGYVDFSTANEDTMIFTDVLPDKIDKTSKTLVDMLSDARFEEEHFQSERKIILHEIAEVADDPWAMADELLRKKLFKTHPIRRPVLGLRKTVNKITLDMLEATYRAQYTPENIIVILTGNFSEEDVTLVTQRFSCIERQKANPILTHYSEKGAHGKDAVKKKTGIMQAYLSIGARTVATKHPDTPVLDVIDTLMGAGASSRLFIELREKRALAYSIESGHENGSDYGYFHINCAIEPKRVEEAKKLIYKEISKLSEEKIPQEELTKTKDMIIGSVMRTIDSPTDFPETLANMEMRYGNQNALQDYIIKIKAVDESDIVEAANKYLSQNRLISSVVLPK